MSKNERKGILIAVEGIDGAGKTTQVKLLAEELIEAGEDIVVSKEPTDGVWGQKIRRSAETGRLPLGEELEAFVQDRKEHIENLIAPSLDEGKTVILDRYFYSTISYQGSRGADYIQVEKQMKDFAPVPDMVFLLDIDPKVSLSRIAELRQEIPNQFEKLETLTNVREVFNEIEKSDEEIFKLDGNKSIEAIHHTIINLLLENAFKEKRCAKPYGCHDYYHCGFRMTGNCEWIYLYQKLLSGKSNQKFPALLSE